VKILVFSDSHNETPPMFRAVEAEKPDTIIHLGDNLSDALALGVKFEKIPLICVRGNCDWGGTHPEEETAELCGRKILVTHGHLYGVKSGLNRISLKGREAGADLVLFGHTHRAYIARSGGVHLFNPGAVSGRGRDRDRTYGVVC
jgi:hypothetical protein